MDTTVNQRSLNHLGCSLAYEISGNPAGPRVVLIQGVGVAGSGWRPQIEALSKRFHCLTFDNRGMGASQPAGGAITIDQLADDTRAILDAEGWSDAHVVGHSLGGLVAIQFALTHRAHVKSLSLLCTFADGRIPTRMTPRMIWLGMRSRIGPRTARRRAFLRFVLPSDALRVGTDKLDAFAADLAPLFGHDLADQPPVTMKQLGAMKRCDLTSRLPELAGVQTLVISAAHDPIAPPRAGRAIAAGIPGARYVEFADASHGVPIHQADSVNSLLLEHLTRA